MVSACAPGAGAVSTRTDAEPQALRASIHQMEEAVTCRRELTLQPALTAERPTFAVRPAWPGIGWDYRDLLARSGRPGGDRCLISWWRHQLALASSDREPADVTSRAATSLPSILPRRLLVCEWKHGQLLEY